MRRLTRQFRLNFRLRRETERAAGCRWPGRVARFEGRAYRDLVLSKLGKVWILGAFLALAQTLVACGSGGGSPANSAAVANQRLSGSWRLQSFTPEVPLDLPLQAVLSAELGNLVVTFNQNQVTAAGPGLNFNGRYEVANAAGDQLDITLYDPQGVAYHFTSQFSGNLLNFQSTDKPWRGMGALQRN